MCILTRNAALGTLILCLFAATEAKGQSSLSQNSGINNNDTWIAMDITISSQATINTSGSYYNPLTQTTSNSFPISRPPQTFHVELGYDSNGGLVMNLWPKGTTTETADGIGVIRFSGGQVTVFDDSGNPIPLQVPNANMSTVLPPNLLGSNPGASVIKTLVVPNISTFASNMNATIVKTYSTTEYTGTSTQVNQLSVPPTTSMETANSTWTYYLSNGYWIAAEMDSSPKIKNGTASQTIQYANVTWFDNASNDSARAAKGFTAQPPWGTTSTGPNGFSSTSSNSSTIVSQLGGSQNVVLQHGIFSSASTWTRMTNWLNQDFLFGTEIVPSLNSTDSLANQCTALENEINSVGGNGYLLIGHSQGGLISRCAAQHYQSLGITPSPTKGVATVDTPHQGADLDLNGQIEVAELIGELDLQLFSDLGCDPNNPFTDPGCFLSYIALGGSGLMGDYALWTNAPATLDLVPGSNFLQQLNNPGQPENFLRAGIVSLTRERWSVARVADEVYQSAIGSNCNPDDWCGERSLALAVTVFYDVLKFFYYFSEFECYVNGDDNACTDAETIAQVLYDMDAVDGTWNALVDPFQSGSDGIVQASSEYYPTNNSSTAATQYIIHGADSHLGSTRSPYVRTALSNALTQTFNVPTQASCTFSVSPPNFSIQSSGGNSSFSLNTQAGCKWSVLSNAVWMSITSATSGVSSATISFSVNSNPASVPRIGTIIAGTDKASATFTVTQFGVCSYTLANSTVAIPAGGGTATDNVYTQYWCPWSAVPNASWLSITSGASGTGNGSFTVSASSNTGNTSLLGTVTVMSQTLNVVVGDPVGTPGTGSITINGGPRSKQVCDTSCDPSCRLHSCAMTVWESGSVIVTIGGDSYTVSYAGSGWTASNLATTLANQINSTSLLVSASASNSIITLVAKENGVLTNYSLTTSDSFDTNFSSPAATATLSGSAMTGGTD